MATTSKTRTFGVTCPHCRDEDAEIVINVNDLADCRCLGCEETFSPQQARDLAAAELARWEKVVRWVEAAGAILAE